MQQIQTQVKNDGFGQEETKRFGLGIAAKNLPERANGWIDQRLQLHFDACKPSDYA